MIQIPFRVLRGSDLLILFNVCHVRMYVRKLLQVTIFAIVTKLDE